MSPLLAFNNDAKLKKLLVAEIRKHRKQDQIVQGTYGRTEGKKWKGCAVGCAIHSLNIRLKGDWDTSNHAVYETELGISKRLAYLEDSIFEGLAEEEAKDFPLAFMEAIPVGADLSRVIPAFCEWLLVDPFQGVIRFAREEDKPIIRQVAELHAKEATGEVVDETKWSAAESAARSAAESAAESAARSAAESAARSAARSAAESAAESAQAKKLIELLKAAPVPSSR
jgi:hypothetical protein